MSRDAARREVFGQAVNELIESNDPSGEPLESWTRHLIGYQSGTHNAWLFPQMAEESNQTRVVFVYFPWWIEFLVEEV